MVISIQGTGDLNVHFQLISSSPDDAATISQLLQAGILLRQYDATKSDPDLATLLASVRVVPNGEGLDVFVAVTSDQLLSLIKRKHFFSPLKSLARVENLAAIHPNQIPLRIEVGRVECAL